MQRRFHFLSALAGGLIAALAVTALPAIAQDAETQASPGDPFLLGQTNIVDANTSLRGDTSGANLVIRNTGDGAPLSLKNNTGGVPNGNPPMEVDSRRLVRNLNVDKVDFRHANELIRAAHGATDDAADANGDAVTATIAAPKPGILIMGGGIEAIGAPEDDYSCRLTVNGTLVTGTVRFSRVHDAGGLHTANPEEDCSTDGGWAVEAGTYTVALKITNRNVVTLNDASVWVIWVPFDGNGDVPFIGN